MRRFALAAWLAAAILAGCSSGESEDAVPIGGTVREISPTQLEVIVGCYESVRVEVDETPDEATLRAFGTEPIDGDCGTFDVVTLRDPLGDRPLIDGMRNRPIVLSTIDG